MAMTTPAVDVPTNFCRSCGHRIQWYRTTTGKLMPVNAATSPNGNIRIDQNLLGDPIAMVVTNGTGDRLAHFVTCPHADQWRTK